MVDRRRFLAVAGAALAVTPIAACASSGGSSDRPRRDPNVLTREELAAEPRGTLLQVVERLRPNWLRSRNLAGSNNLPRVHVDGSPQGSVEMLRSIQVQDVRRLEFMSGPDATTRYGTGYVGGVILVSIRSGEQQ